MMRAVICLLSILLTANAVSNRTQSPSFVSLISPGVIPYSLGVFRFDTLSEMTFPLDNIYPASARTISVMVFIRSGMNSGEAPVNIWLWTVCPELGIRDTKFKRAYRYHQSAYSFDSETLDLLYCASQPELHLVTDNQAGNVLLEVFAIGYTNA